MVKIFQAESTNICNGYCGWCTYDKMTRPKGFLSTETLQLALEKYEPCFQTIEPFCHIHQDKTLELHHFGEPLLHPNLDQIVQNVSDAGIKPIVATNGLLLTKMVVAQLKACGLGALHVQWNKFKPYQQCLISAKQGIETLVIVLTDDLQKVPESLIQHRQISILRKAGAKIYIKRLRNFDGQESHLEKKDCVWLKEDWKVMLWDGRLVTCCHDYDAEGVVGNIEADEIKANKPYKKCRNCAGFSTERDYEGYILGGEE
jgi:hypothetical protein